MALRTCTACHPRPSHTHTQARRGISKEGSPARGDQGGGGGDTHPAPGARKEIAREIMGPRPPAPARHGLRGGFGQGAARESLSHQGCSLLAPSPAADARITCIVNLSIVFLAPHTRRATPPGQRGRPVERERASAEQQTTALAQGSASEGNALPAGAWRATGPRDGSAG